MLLRVEMANDPERDIVPSKEIKEHFDSPRTLLNGKYVFERPSVSDMRAAVQLSRDELEDNFYQIKEENFKLKKSARLQEDHLKKLATKMSRLLKDKKKMEMNSNSGHKQDVEMQEIIEDLQEKVRMLEKNNTHLREKLLVAKQQVIIQRRKPNAYPHVGPKVNTGRPKSNISPYSITANVRGKNMNSPQRKLHSVPLTPYAMQLLEEARNELSAFKELVSSQKAQIDIYEQEVEILKEQLRIKETEFEEDVNILKLQITQGQRQHVQENLDLIRLHRELKQKTSKFAALQTQYVELEEKMKAQKANHDHLLKEIEDLNNNLKEERKNNLELFTELQQNKAALNNLAGLEENFKLLKNENNVLKDTNDKLIKSVLCKEKERGDESVEQSLRNQISSLEESLKVEQNAKNSLVAEVQKEKENYSEVNSKYSSLQENFMEAKNQMEEMKSKVDLLKTQEVDFNELGEALALIKLKKQRGISLEFLERVPNYEEEDLRSRLKKSESDHVETLKELCSMREMLMTQYKVNKDVQAEMQNVSENFAQQEKEYQTKLEEYAHLLDLRAARIQKLERQLNDIAYGTKQFKVKEFQEGSDLDNDDQFELHRGENILEIHIDKVIFSKEGLRVLGSSSPSTFVTWTFYEYEIQSSPVVKGPKPFYNCTAQYTIRVDDFFLYYIFKHSTTLELHESLGTDYKTVGTCQMNFSEVVNQPYGRLHGSQQLIGVNDLTSGTILGTIEYWVRLRIPLEEAFKLHKEKFKALKYIQGNQERTDSAIKFLELPFLKEANINDLHIKIIRCLNLRGRSDDLQPSSFCMYKFYDLPDQDTAIIPASNSPEFSDHRRLPLHMDFSLDQYLKTQKLEVFVFDDEDPEISSYIGKAVIPLLPLTQNQPVKGVFELMKDDETGYGAIEVSLYWQHSYQPLSDVVSLPKSLDEAIEYPPHVQPTQSMHLHSENMLQPREQGSKIPVPQPRTRLIQQKESKSLSAVISDTTSLNSQNMSTSSTSKSALHKPVAAPRCSVSSSKVQPNTFHEHESREQSSSKSPKKGIEVTLPSQTPNGNYNNYNEEAKQNESMKEEGDEDTMTEKKQEISFEEISEDDKQAFAGDDADLLSESDEGAAHMSETSSLSQQLQIIIAISHLMLEPHAPVLDDPSIQMLYAEYRFLDFPLEELETPFSLPKPIPLQKIIYNFVKVFTFDPEENQDRYQLLAEMLHSDSPEASWIKFTIVSEPPADQQDLDCEDVGYAYVDLEQIILHKKDIIEEDIAICDAKNTESKIGTLNVTVQALKVLQKLQELS